jgi:hypothetical protein
VGITGEGGSGEIFPWRFWLEGEASVSTYRPGLSRRRIRRGDDIVQGAVTARSRTGTGIEREET